MTFYPIWYKAVVASQSPWAPELLKASHSSRCCGRLPKGPDVIYSAGAFVKVVLNCLDIETMSTQMQWNRNLRNMVPCKWMPASSQAFSVQISILHLDDDVLSLQPQGASLWWVSAPFPSIRSSTPGLCVMSLQSGCLRQCRCWPVLFICL